MVEKKYINCNVCNSSEYSILYKDELGDDIPNIGYNFTPDSKKTYQIVKCNSCGLVYTNPMPDISEFYEDTVDEIYLAAKESRLRTAEKCVQEILKFKGGGALLDIGCATGCFLDMASKHFNVTGIELSEWAYKEASKRHEVYNVPLSELNLQKEFDVITLFGVIEHFTYPSKELDLISNVLKPGGLLVIYTPDVGGWLPRLMGKRWWNIMGQHLYYFSKDTCRAILKKSGFEVKKVMVYPHYFKLSSIGDSMKRYMVGKLVKPVLDLPFMRDVMMPLKLSGEMLVLAFKQGKGQN
jgi:SAM-dependent methyltransferase